MKVMLKNVRLAFPNLFTPQAGPDGGDAKYNATFIIEDEENVKRVNEAIEQVAQDKWGAKAAENLKALRSKGRICLRDGEDKADYDGFDGNHYINASNKVAPAVFDRDKSKLSERDGKPYAGCYVDASVDVWAQDNQYGKRINSSLRGVKFAQDGEPFAGGGAATEDDFEFEDADDSAADDLT